MMSLLIVEDNAKMRRMLKSLVADLASAVHECSDGAQALAAYAEARPDWVLMDIAMKELDGISATRAIKAAWPEARIIIVTSYDEAELRAAALNLARRTARVSSAKDDADKHPYTSAMQARGTAAPVAPALVATITVNDAGTAINATDGKCTLTEAIIAANTDTASGAVANECVAGSGPDTININLPPGTVISFSAPHNWEFGLNALPIIQSNITIQGNGAIIQRVNGAPKFRFFYVAGSSFGGLSPGTLTLRDLSLQGGLAKGGDSGSGGGGIGGDATTVYDTGGFGGTVTGTGGSGGGGFGGCCIGSIGVYRQGVFHLRPARLADADGNPAGAEIVVEFGLPGDWPVVGDWDGDGVTTIGVYRQSQFLLRNSNRPGPADIVINFGEAADLPLSGDWDGDGQVTLGVYNPTKGLFRLSNTFKDVLADIEVQWGGPSYLPVVGDWDGDGMTTLGLYSVRGEFLLRIGNVAGPPDLVFTLGVRGGLPIAGNWAGAP